MSANVEFDVVHQIVSPYATLDLSTPLAGPAIDGFTPYYLVTSDGYDISPGKFRSVIDSVSQDDGSSMQEPYIDGLVATFRVDLMQCVNGDLNTARPACLSMLRYMNETLMGVLNSLRLWTADPNTMQRFIWTPSGGVARRMLTNALLAAWPAVTVGTDPAQVSYVVKIGTPLPGAISEDQTDTPITDGGSALIDTVGNANTYPVFQVQGPTSGFTITNETTGATFVYDASRVGGVAIGGGDYAEIAAFQGSIFLNGDGAYLIAAVTPQSLWFPLVAGPQTVSIVGADMSVLWNASFV